MKWDNGTRFAFTPRICDCGHTVWLEKYHYLGDREIVLGIDYASLPIYKCKDCYKKKK